MVYILDAFKQNRECLCFPRHLCVKCSSLKFRFYTIGGAVVPRKRTGEFQALILKTTDKKQREKICVHWDAVFNVCHSKVSLCFVPATSSFIFNQGLYSKQCNAFC